MNNKPLPFELFSTSQELNTTQHLKILKKIRMMTMNLNFVNFTKVYKTLGYKQVQEFTATR